MGLSQFSGVIRRDEARTRTLVLGQEGSEDNRLFPWIACICGVLEISCTSYLCPCVKSVQSCRFQDSHLFFGERSMVGPWFESLFVKVSKLS